jgi:hypothetical protein
VDNDERQRHSEKQISPYLKKCEKTKLPIFHFEEGPEDQVIDLKDQQAHDIINSETPPRWSAGE